MSRRRTSIATVVVAMLVAAIAAVVITPSEGRIVEAALTPTGAAGEFHAVTPIRVFSSRPTDPEPDVEPLGKKPTDTEETDAAEVEFHVPVLGQGEVPADNVLAIAANVTIVNPTRGGYLTAYPKGGEATYTSIANFRSSDSEIANSVILRPGADGSVTFRFATGSPGEAHLLLDVSGYWSTDAAAERGSRLRTVDPFRVYDSTDSELGGGAPLDSAETATIPIRGVGPIPDDPAVTAVMVNVTGANTFVGSLPTWFSMLPEEPDELPTTSTLNLAKGAERANGAIVPIGDDGAIRLFNFQGVTRGVVDVTGYLEQAGESDTTTAGRVIPLMSPFRVGDTREPEWGSQPLGPKSAETWSFDSFVADVTVINPDSGEPEWIGPQQGLLGNLTAVGLELQYVRDKSSFLSVYPAGEPGDDECKPADFFVDGLPRVSNVNFPESVAVPNLALLRYGGGDEDPHRVCVFNNKGYIHYLLDVSAVILS